MKFNDYIKGRAASAKVETSSTNSGCFFKR